MSIYSENGHNLCLAYVRRPDYDEADEFEQGRDFVVNLAPKGRDLFDHGLDVFNDAMTRGFDRLPDGSNLFSAADLYSIRQLQSVTWNKATTNRWKAHISLNFFRVFYEDSIFITKYNNLRASGYAPFNSFVIAHYQYTHTGELRTTTDGFYGDQTLFNDNHILGALNIIRFATFPGVFNRLDGLLIESHRIVSAFAEDTATQNATREERIDPDLFNKYIDLATKENLDALANT